jgi:hypothetical protein
VTVTDATSHHRKCTACRFKAQQLQQLHSLPPKGSLALHSLKSARSALPIPPAGPLDSKLSGWGSFSPLLTEKSGVLAPATSMDQHKGRLVSQCGSVWGSSRLAAQGSHEVQELKTKQGLAQVLDAALPAAAAEASGDSLTSRASSSALIPHCIAEEGTEGGSSSSQPSSPSPCCDLSVLTSPRQHRHHHHLDSCIAEAASEGSSQPSTPPSAACVDADVVVLTCKHSGVELPAKGPNGEDLIVARDSPTAKDQHMVVYLQNLTTAAHSVASELGEAAELRCTCGKDVGDELGSRSSRTSDSGTSMSGVIGDSWWALLKIVWPFCLAVQPAPMTTATILPLNLSSQVANVSLVRFAADSCFLCACELRQAA